MGDLQVLAALYDKLYQPIVVGLVAKSSWTSGSRLVQLKLLRKGLTHAVAIGLEG